MMIRSIVVLLFLAGIAAAGEKDIAGTPHVYKKAGDRELKLYIVNPADWKAADKRPAIVFYFGGGFVGGTPSQFNEQAKYLASRGIVAVLVKYRTISKKKARELPIVCIQDAKSAMRWVRGHAAELGIDPNRIASGGGSAGGYLGAFVGMIDGIDDPQDDGKISAKANAMVLFNPLIDTEYAALKFETDTVKKKDLIPMDNISADDPPAILFFGSEDKLGRNVKDFKAGLEKAGVRCEVRMYEGQGHGFFNYGSGSNKYYYETLREADMFLVSLGWLKGEPTLKELK